MENLSWECSERLRNQEGMVCDGPASHRPPFSECTWGVFAVFCEKSFLDVEWNSTRWSVLWFLLPLTLCDPCLPFPFFGFFQVWCLEKTLGPLGSGSLCSPGSQSCWGSKESEGDWCEQWGRSLAMPVLSREGQPESLYFWCVYFL